MKKLLEVVEAENGDIKYRFHEGWDHLGKLGLLSILRYKILNKEGLSYPEDEYFSNKEKKGFWTRKRGKRSRKHSFNMKDINFKELDERLDDE